MQKDWLLWLRECKTLLKSKAIQEIFDMPESTFFKRLREARQGKGGLPLPLELGGKRGLRWNPEHVRVFLESQSQPALSREPPAEQRKELDDAMKSLKSQGVKIGNATNK